MLRSRKKNIKNDRRKPNRIYFKILFYLALIFFLGAIIYVLFFSLILRIASINIEGNNNVSQQLILDKINLEISGKYFNYINKDNLLLFKANKMEKEILREFKDIREIKIKKIFPDHLVVSIIERIPELIFCSNEKCFIVDENGQAYDNQGSSNEENKNNLIVIIDESNREVNLGDQILENDYIGYMQGIRKKMFDSLNLEVESNFQTPNLISKDIRIRTKEGWMIYFNQNISLEKEIEMLSLALNNKIEKEKRGELEYVDLRIENKIYYKFKGETANNTRLEKKVEEVKGATVIIENEKKTEKNKKKK